MALRFSVGLEYNLSVIESNQNMASKGKTVDSRRGKCEVQNIDVYLHKVFSPYPV